MAQNVGRYRPYILRRSLIMLNTQIPIK